MGYRYATNLPSGETSGFIDTVGVSSRASRDSESVAHSCESEPAAHFREHWIDRGAAEQLLDPARRPSSSDYSPPDFFEIDTQDCPAECFRLLARDNPDMPDTVDQDRAVARKLEAGLAHRYLAVYRTLTYSPPRVMSSEDHRISGQPNDGRSRFSPGHGELEVFVFDLQSNEMVASFRTAHTSSSQTVANLATLESEMRAGAREGILAGLRRRTG